jgi:hypothetical protein
LLTEILITSSQYWTVPLDWSNLNSIEVIGGGQGGGSFYRWWGGSRLDYGYGGAGAGYVKVQNFNLLIPGQSIFIVVGSGGSGAPDAGSSGGGSGYSGSGSSFSSYLQAYGGQQQSAWPFMVAGSGSYSLPAGSYTSVSATSGSLGNLYYGGSPGYGGNAGAPGYSGYGKGGNSQNYYNANYGVGGASTPGSPGIVRITYTPSGTQQACVWIS